LGLGADYTLCRLDCSGQLPLRQNISISLSTLRKKATSVAFFIAQARTF
jgi:hypothetical protein